MATLWAQSRGLVSSERLSRSSVTPKIVKRNSSSSSSRASMEQAMVPAVIVGGGRVGSALEKMGGGKDIIVRRGENVPLDSSGPIFVCTRNDVLNAVFEATPPHRYKDLVFVQNGMLEPWLESKGIPDASQVLVYFAVAKLGDPPIDGKTDTNPEGLTAASGKWAPAVAARLHSAGLSCRVLSSNEFQKPMLEKLIWICAFMLVGARHPGSTVGVVEKDYNDEVVALIKELAEAAASAKSLTFDAGVEARLCAYARSVAHFPTALKEFEWRNGWFYELSKKNCGKI
ncbi:hypothetical protein GOP47_0022835 [Adiantum capillus-veneris]|uniref:Uncharacterized protein n=1 Tax=Adiantum capillus-veneris TaxID=13818 RepID=A0A9D4U8H1_ADICA|nr:hypothetical protein GOP47_0022835 [Adiantum capillus-veneris]